MKKLLFVIFVSCFLSACTGSLIEKQQPVCQATAMLGGQPQSVQIYGVRTVANQVEFRAGYPFNWRWVNKNNFTSSTCK
ncbi:phage exclusion lipoprotein Cor [Phytobacter sp. V91]|uniref:phage exclusion lipoprotein Cor n=1 Tax=Phytobacter sp. V91 TaxID=3369425 RepID=UPI003F5ED6FF